MARSFLLIKPSDYCRAPAHFAVKIPDEIPTAEAAPMLCGGVTVSVTLSLSTL